MPHKDFTKFHDGPEHKKKKHDGPEGVAIRVHYYVSNPLFFFNNWWLSAWKTARRTTGNNIKSLLKRCLFIEGSISTSNHEDKGEESNGLKLEKQISLYIKLCQRWMKSSAQQGSSHLQNLHVKICTVVKNC